MQNGQTDLELKEEILQRRRFLTTAGGAGLAAAAALMLPGKANALIPSTSPNPSELDNTSGDTVVQIFTAALIAEDLATTFYFNGLHGPVIQDPNLAGPGGRPNHVSPSGNVGNVNYLQAAFLEEISHANLLRQLLGPSSPDKDPVQMFYLPTGCFDTLGAFTAVLDALENAFIGAYLAATLEFAQMAADSRASGVHQVNSVGRNYGARQLEWFSQVAASIMGIECEHRVLGRVISNTNPANQLIYEQTDGVKTVYNGTASAVAALTPFLAPGAGLTGYSFRQAYDARDFFPITVTGNPPPPPPARADGQ